jgi:hypothetical protein
VRVENPPVVEETSAGHAESPGILHERPQNVNAISSVRYSLIRVIGCSGWLYRSWRADFNPDSVPHYRGSSIARRIFDTVAVLRWPVKKWLAWVIVGGPVLVYAIGKLLSR